MAGRLISSNVVDSVAHEVIQGMPIAHICKKYNLARGTVNCIRKGAHASLSIKMKNKLTSFKKTHLPQQGHTARDFSKLAAENAKLRSTLMEIVDRICSFIDYDDRNGSTAAIT